MYNKEKIGVAIAMSMGVLYAPTHPDSEPPLIQTTTNTTPSSAGITCIIKMTTISLLYNGDFSCTLPPLPLLLATRLTVNHQKQTTPSPW